MKSWKREITEKIELPIMKESELLERRKITNTWEYLKQTPSNRLK